MTELENQLLAVLRECDEAMAYMSEYDIPLTLPDRVKEAIAAAEAAQAVAQPCWSCKKPVSIAQRANSDGNCPHCHAELDDCWPQPASAQQEAAPGNDRGAMFIHFLSVSAAKAGHKELAADLLAALRTAGETGIQGLPALAEPACQIAEVSDEEVAIACTPAQRQQMREGMLLYAAPVAVGAIQVRKLGKFGKVYDGPQEKRAYTYTDQPHNVAAWSLGRAAANVSAGGDLIDRGLSLLSTLQAEGFGVFEMADDSLAAGPQEGGAA